MVLFYPLARRIILPLALLFHCFNTFFLGVPFAAILSIYLAFPDWQAIYQRYYPKRLRLKFLKQLSGGMLISLALILSTLVGLSWNTTPLPRTIFGLGGLVRYQTIWFVVFPIVLLWIFAALYRTFSRQKP
ncbi:MAG: hypothetical protein HC890_18780 [Chloroflexaceae bacterium]|nr:hypothetical protein [Chloroflexaceae bacterium]